MGLEIIAFTPKYAEGCAALLAKRHARDTKRDPILPRRFAEIETARVLFHGPAHANGMVGSVALRAGQVVGYVLGRILFPEPESVHALVIRPGSVVVAYECHAVDSAESSDLYRALYAAVSPSWVAAGGLSHYVVLPASDDDALRAWFSLGFGQDQTHGLRDTMPGDIVNDVGPTTIRRARVQDMDEVGHLVTSLIRHHAAPPIFLPFVPEAAASLREYHMTLLSDNETRCWLAEQDGRVIGLQLFTPPSFGVQMVTPERCIEFVEAYTVPAFRGSGIGTALLHHALADARSTGYEYCGASWMTANLYARHWTQAGFRPVSHRLARHIDERIGC